MAKTLHLDIVTPEKPTASLDVEEVSLPAAEGEMGVLPGHMPYVTALRAGELRYHKDGKVELLAISGGFAEVRGDSVLVLAETAEMAAEIDVKRAEAKITEKSQAIKAQAMNPADIDRMRAELLKEIVRMKVADKAGKR
jgi:F-type H+-transporting ATPase subunit epsilon